MFNFLRRPRNDNRQMNYSYPNPDYYPQNNPYQVNQPSINTYDLNVLEAEVAETKRQINDLYKRLTRLESYLGIRENTNR